MRCPECNGDNPPQARFCLECGAALACPACGTERPTCARSYVAGGAQVASPAAAAPPAAQAIPERLQRLIPKEYAERLLATRSQPHKEH